MKKLCLICILTTILLVTAKAQAGQFSDWEDLIDSKILSQQISTIWKSNRLLLEQSRYDEIESSANRYRNSKEIYVDGIWALAELYDGLSYHLKMPNENLFQERLNLLKNWVAAKPDSITARVALADCMIGYAFHGRGYGMASTISEEQWHTFHTRLKEAESILMQAKSLKQKCPGWWAAYLRIASVDSYDRSKYEQLFNDAIAFEPKYYTFYYYRAWDLLPQWHSDKGEWEQFAKSAADRCAGDEGDMLYAGIILYMDTRGPCENKKNKNPNISWDRVTRGINLLKAKSIK
ncbi:exported hypothetical protein [Syntrophobacter sp. SbD1]|nr:exported hypothetical protein [Syntrophobacter sp. SbD1]